MKSVKNRYRWDHHVKKNSNSEKIENNMFSLMCRICIFKKDMKLDRKRKRTNRMEEGRQYRVAVR